VNPNIGGSVIRDIDLPDRDLFVYDAQTLALESVVDTLGTMLSGIAARQGENGTRLWIPHTEAQNEIDGLRDLDNKLFLNRVAVVDCNGGSCTPANTVDLDQSLAAASSSQTAPIPWGIQASGDGQTVVVTAAGADGDPGDGRPPMHGLFTLDANGNVRGSALVGALPEGVLLSSNAQGQAQVAYVLNTATAACPCRRLIRRRRRPAPVVVGADPTPAEVRLGRIAFNGARGATNQTFACGSCHPNGNIDQLQWVINTTVAPSEGPGPDGQIAEPRTTQPIRGLRDTLPLHWEGVLADPIAGVNPEAADFDSADCDIAVVGEIGCVRHLVDAALSGPMCQHNTPNGCEVGEGQDGPSGAGLPGALTEEERNAMAAFQLAVAFPPAPSRRPDDKLSDFAVQGVSDFFTNEDLQGINTGVGQALGFAPTTCADNPMGCHSLPLTAGTNSNVVGGFDAASARGMWDRFTLFSNGIFSSQEVLQGAQDCANGIEPPPRTFEVVFGGNPIPITLSGDPCNVRSPEIELFLFRLAALPFPSGETIWDPAVGHTERGSFIATFEGLFALVYGVRGDAIWQFQEEIGRVCRATAGRSRSSRSQDDPLIAQLDLRALRARGSHRPSRSMPRRRRSGGRGVGRTERLPADDRAVWRARAAAPLGRDHHGGPAGEHPRRLGPAAAARRRSRPASAGGHGRRPGPAASVRERSCDVPGRRRIRRSGRDGADQRRGVRGLLAHAGRRAEHRQERRGHDDRSGPREGCPRRPGAEPERLVDNEMPICVTTRVRRRLPRRRDLSPQRHDRRDASAPTPQRRARSCRMRLRPGCRRHAASCGPTVSGRCRSMTVFCFTEPPRATLNTSCVPSP
jgi:hypothetical protein